MDERKYKEWEPVFYKDSVDIVNTSRYPFKEDESPLLSELDYSIHYVC